ncbi:MAG: hypothetical protein R3D71_03700 [Rickettsiales bacterium]
MHWFVGYLCHTHGTQDWLVNDGAVQARNVVWAAIPSMGECWHNNHHAFPASAKHGVYPGQLDIGYHYVRLLERIGLASISKHLKSCLHGLELPLLHKASRRDVKTATD